jgi:uncharacterized protein (DUF927 family)
VSSDKLIYVFTDAATDQNYQLQTGQPTTSRRTQGTLAEWNENIWQPASKSPWGVFLVMAALSSPLLKAAQMDSGGFNFYGGSSSGKTTGLQIAASVNGNGADPSESGRETSINRWNGTANAFEGLAAASNDSTSCFDELGSCPDRDFKKIVYDLTGGQGKSAMDSKRNMKVRRFWRATILSTGEISIRQKIEQSVPGKKEVAKAGQLLRIIDLMIKEPIFGSRQLADKIKRSCSRYYGTLGDAFVRSICEKFESELQFRETVQTALDSAVQRLVDSVGLDVSSVVERAIKRFALAEVAGIMLVSFDLIPGLTAVDIRRAIDAIVMDWALTSGELDDSVRAITSLREFILANKDIRFKSLDARAWGKEEKINRELAGYYDYSRGAYFLLPAAFREATGCEPKLIAKKLKDLNLLVVEKSQKGFMARITVNEDRIMTYGIKASILGSDIDDEEAS